MDRHWARRAVLADAEGAEALVAVAADLLRVPAAQHVDDVRGAEALACAVDAGQQFLRFHRPVPGLGRRQADIAVAAVVREVISEIFQQRPAAAGGDLAPAEQCVEFHPLDALVFLARFGLVDQLAQAHDILQAVDHPRFGGLPVAAGPSRLLVIGFHALRQVHMGHEPHIGLVDAHAEGDGRRDDHAVLVLEAGLVGGARRRGQAGMIGQGGESPRRQQLRQ